MSNQHQQYHTSFEANLPLQHMIVNKETGDLYLGGINFIYHLTSNLSLVDEQSSLTADITNFCSSGDSGCILPPEWGENENKVLLIDEDNDFLIACGSAFNGTCVLHHLNSITTVQSRVHDLVHHEEASLGIGDSVVAFYGPSTVNTDGQQAMGTALFVGASFNPLFNDTLIRQHAVSTKLLLQRNSRWTFDLAYQELRFGRYTYIDVREEHAHNYPIKYINGFTFEGFSYLTTVQKEDVDSENYHSRLVRICNKDSAYYSYTEVPLKCRSYASGRTYNLLQAAHVSSAGVELARDLNMKVGDMALFGLFAESSPDAPDQPTSNMAMCIFTLKKITKKVRDGVQNCFFGYGSQGLSQFSDNLLCSYSTYRNVDDSFCGTGDLHPIQAQTTVNAYDYLTGGGHGRHYTSLSTLTMGRDTVAVMGTKSGRIHKFVIDPLSVDFVRRDYPLKPYKDLKLDTEGPVLRDMPLDSEQEHIYVMTPYKVYKIALKTCEHYIHCSACVTSRDPNGCGWCGGVCTTEEECDGADGPSGEIPETEVDSEDDPDWVTDACSPAIYEVSPVFGPLQGDTTVNIIGDSLVADAAVNANSTLEVIIAGQPCHVDLSSSNITHIVCVTPSVEEPVSGPVTIEVEVDDPSLTFAIGGFTSSEPRYIFSYVEPAFTHFSPLVGPMFGRTMITLFGEGLHAGNNPEVTVAGVPCHIHSVTPTKIHCVTRNSSELTSGPVILNLDSLQLNSTLEFTYAENPYITHFSPTKSYLSGGNNLQISGFNLHLGQNVQLEVSALTDSGHRVIKSQGCTVPWHSSDDTIPSGTLENSLTCTTPDLSDEELNPTPDQPFIANLTIKFNKNILVPMSYDGQIELPMWKILYYPDPILEQFEDHIYLLDLTSNTVLIRGEYLDLVSRKEDISVTVGSQPCAIQEFASTYIVCQVPSSLQQSGNGSGIYEVKVTMGDNQAHNVGLLQVPRPEGIGNTPIALTIIGILTLLALVILIVVIGIKRYHKSKRGERLPIDNTHVGFNHMAGTEEVHLQGQGLHRINTYLTNPGMPANEAMPIMHAPLLEQINNELAAEISQVLIHEEKIAVGKVLGQGHFGCVFAGKLHQDGEEHQVAVKSLHQGTLNEISNFLREGIMMKDFKHRNVLSLIGVCIISDTNMPYVVLPFMKNGDILTFVRDPSNELTARQLLEFCRQIAEGMMYLAGLKFVHRDLAARNCMLDKDMVVKVGDFGLSRDIYERSYYSAKDRTAKLPVRWMALECLERNIYNTRTDVWSFGVVMWELLTRGIVPYPSVDNVDILTFLHGGRRLSQPEHCPDHVYEVMLSCWSVSPIDRPSFCLLVDNLDGILMVKSEDPADQEKTDAYVNIPGAAS
ncbi:hepatocyte growth factor receptor [Strongylocentrotus purpuratus]|uniref:Hepatocyte growth factor receptor n=1 Tax=Strongylocentrotus purpuratus TaxID=7668 RepID=A0A7M7PSZ6_STRPU|nr:hepatocyte growth factor receptor [Strongylocentrotus purpuratus]